MVIRFSAWILLAGMLLTAQPLVAGDAWWGTPWHWCNAANRQLGWGWSDGYHARNRMSYGEPEWYSTPAAPIHTMPTPAMPVQHAPPPVKQPSAPLQERPSLSAAPTKQAPWSIFPWLGPTGPAEPYPRTNAPTVASLPTITGPAPAPQAVPQAVPQVVPQMAARPQQPAPVVPRITPPPAARPVDPPSGAGGFYPEEMPAAYR